jgi:1-acyl-sn-glycerol-3-phosphate acyltransferase
MKQAPSALIVPISINNSWKMLRYGKFPYGIGSHLYFKVHTPMENNGDPDNLLAKVEEVINNDIRVTP